MYGKILSNKVISSYSGERTVTFNKHFKDSLVPTFNKMKLDSYLTSYIKINSRYCKAKYKKQIK